MPYSITYNKDDGGVITNYSGILNGESIINATKERLASTRDIKSYRYFLSDYSEVTDFNVSSKTVQKSAQLALQFSKIIPKLHLVIIMPTDLKYGIARMWQSYATDEVTGWKTKVVKTRKQATKWIEENLNSL